MVLFFKEKTVLSREEYVTVESSPDLLVCTTDVSATCCAAKCNDEHKHAAIIT